MSMIPSSPSSQAMLAVPASSTNMNGSSLSPQTILPAPVERSLYSSMHKLFKTQMNRFGLFRLYNMDTPPLHDPEDPSSVKNMCSPRVHLNLSTNLYHPYPNETSMHLGDWYWNQGAQKSQESFKQLLSIIGDPMFSPSAISQTTWGTIDAQLRHNQFDGDVLDWLGEDNGWKCSSVMISVPFHSQSRSPGAKDYEVNGFYHQSLVSIIREKITDPVHRPLIHFKPYELQWHPPHQDHNLKIHGKLFMSTAFLKAIKHFKTRPQNLGVTCLVLLWRSCSGQTRPS